MRVLERSARGVTLTAAGEVLVRHASALLDSARQAEEAVRAAGGVGRAQVRVSAFPSAAAGLMPGATRELRARRPDAEMTLQVSRTSRRSTRCWPAGSTSGCSCSRRC